MLSKLKSQKKRADDRKDILNGYTFNKTSVYTFLSVVLYCILSRKEKRV